MAAQSVDKLRAAFADGDFGAAKRIIEGMDSEIRKTQGFKDTIAYGGELVDRAGDSKDMTTGEYQRRIRKAAKEINEESNIVKTEKARKAKRPIKAEELPPDVKKAGEDAKRNRTKAGTVRTSRSVAAVKRGKTGPTSKTGGTSAAAKAPPAKTSPPAGSPSPAKTSGNTKGAQPGARGTRTAPGGLPGKDLFPRLAAPLDPGAAAGAGRTSKVPSPAASAPKISPAAQKLVASLGQEATTAGGLIVPPARNVRAPSSTIPGMGAVGAGGPPLAAPTPAIGPVAGPPPPVLGPDGTTLGRAGRANLLGGMGSVGAGTNAASAQASLNASNAQLALMNSISTEGMDKVDEKIAAVKMRPRGPLPGMGAIVDPRYLNPDTGALQSMSQRLKTAGGGKGIVRGVGARAFGGLMAAEAGNQLIIDRMAKATNADPLIPAALKGATTGAALGATIGAPIAGVGAPIGAALGGAGGALIGILRGGGGGSKGDFDTASIMAFPGLADSEKRSLANMYQMMIQMGTPAKEAQAAIRQKALDSYVRSQEEEQQYARVIPNVMALQGMAASFAKPYYDDYRAANDQQKAMADSMAAMLPENQRASANAYAAQQQAAGNQTAAAFANSNLLAPAFYLQDALKQNAYSSGTPPLGGMGLSGSMGIAGGGAAPIDANVLKQIQGAGK